MEHLFTSEALIGLLMLTGMEIVLGIDNIIFISIVTSRLPDEQQRRARNIGIILALGIRIALLSIIGHLVTLKSDVITVMGNGFSWRDIIMLGGGIFLLTKSTLEIYEKMETHEEEELSKKSKGNSFANAVLQVIMLDIVFSFDSIVTAVAISNHIEIMIAAVVVSMLIMLAFSGKISNFINRHPSMKMLALSFLLMIGLLLIMDGLGKEINKGYVYFAMAFSFWC